MGSAIVTCCGYWVLSAGILYAVCYSGQSQLSFVQILSCVVSYCLNSIGESSTAQCIHLTQWLPTYSCRE